jgi:hypothetical protein
MAQGEMIVAIVVWTGTADIQDFTTTALPTLDIRPSF